MQGERDVGLMPCDGIEDIFKRVYMYVFSDSDFERRHHAIERAASTHPGVY